MNWHMRKHGAERVQNVPQENQVVDEGKFSQDKIFQLINEGIIDLAYHQGPREIMDAGTDY